LPVPVVPEPAPVVEGTEGAEPSEPVVAAVPEQAKLDMNQLTNTYRDKTTNMFKKVFNRTGKEFFQQFPTIFTVEGTNVRRASEAEVEAIKAKEAEAQAKRDAAEAERKRVAEQRQREALQKIVRDRKSVRDRAINVIVASTSGLKLEAVRRAITTVLTSTRARSYSRIVVCGSSECLSGVREQPYDTNEILQGSYNRLSQAVKHRILLPAMPKGIPRGTEDLWDNEALYQVILPENLEKTLKAEVDAKKKAKEPKVEAPKEGEKAEGEAAKPAEPAAEDAAMKDESTEEVKEEELLPGEERELVVADYYVSIESGILPVKLPPSNFELPTFPVPPKVEEPAAADGKADAEGEQPAAKVQRTDRLPEQCKFYMNGSCKFGSTCRLAHPEPEAVTEFSAEERQIGGTIYVDVAWVVIYNARTGLSVRIPSTGNDIPAKFVDASRLAEFQTTCGTLISDQLSVELDMKINPVDPHKMLNAGVISRGHLLEQALTVGFAQLTHKEMARKRIAAVARAKELAAQRAAEAARKREEAEEKARQDAEKAAADAAAAEAAAAAAAAEAEAAAAEAAASAPATEAAPMETSEASSEAVVVHTQDAQGAADAESDL